MGLPLAVVSTENFYLGCGLFGAAIFILRMILMLAGADADHGDFGHIPDDIPDDVHGDFQGDVSDGDLDPGLRLLTIQGVVAFVMMFGLTGYSMSHGVKAGPVPTLLVSIAIGGATMWLLARTFKLMSSLQSSGTVTLDAATGEHGTVYLTVPAAGVGKVQVKVGSHLRVVDAVSEKKEELKTGERVVVASALDGRTLVVKKEASADVTEA